MPPSRVNLLVLFGLLIGNWTVSVLADSVPPSYRAIAVEAEIPSAILYGVALAESGQKLLSGKFRPWPWTLNVAGVPRRYATRLEAWKSLRYFLKQGIRSIDVGLMQVNWRYHRDRLGTPWQALDPFHNVRAAAGILKHRYAETPDWNRAVGRYHSPGDKPAQKKRAKRYAQRVMKLAQPLK